MKQNRPPAPTPEEIREACALIREEWTEATERARRMIQNNPPDMATPHTVRVERHRVEIR